MLVDLFEMIEIKRAGNRRDFRFRNTQIGDGAFRPFKIVRLGNAELIGTELSGG